MAYGGVDEAVASGGNPTQIFWMVVDNASDNGTCLNTMDGCGDRNGVKLFKIVDDNFTGLTITETGHIPWAVPDSLAIATNNEKWNNIPYVVVDNGSVGVATANVTNLYRGDNLTLVVSDIGVYGMDNSSIDIVVSSDNTSVGVSGWNSPHVDYNSATAYPAFRVWYDE